jgi:hypothetical protein
MLPPKAIEGRTLDAIVDAISSKRVLAQRISCSNCLVKRPAQFQCVFGRLLAVRAQDQAHCKSPAPPFGKSPRPPLWQRGAEGGFAKGEDWGILRKAGVEGICSERWPE